MAKSNENFTLEEVAEIVKSVELRNRVFYNHFLKNRSHGKIYVTIHASICEGEFKTQLRNRFEELGWHFYFDLYRTQAYIKHQDAEFVIVFWSSLTKDWVKKLENLNQSREMLAIEILETRFKLNLEADQQGHLLDKKR